MMKRTHFNLQHVNYERERIGYFVYTRGINREGNHCMMVVRKDPVVSGCNPYYWDPSPSDQYGEEFATVEEAETQAKYAICRKNAYAVKSIEEENIKVVALRVKNTQSVTYIG